MGMGQNLVPLVNIKIAGKWMFIPLKMVLIGIDPSPYIHMDAKNMGLYGLIWGFPLHDNLHAESRRQPLEIVEGLEVDDFGPSIRHGHLVEYLEAHLRPTMYCICRVNILNIRV